MDPYKCIIIEDEPIAAEILQDYIADVPFLKLKKTYADAISALDDLGANDIDVIFLDINLPKLKGLDFIQTLQYPPHIIITTAYHEYALQGYELNIVDYLLKPIEFNRFLKAVNKLKQLKTDKLASPIAFTPTGKDYMFINASKKKTKIYFRDILYIESMKEYVRIFTTDRVLTSKFQLGQIEDQLPKSDFLRIHRSFMVAREKIDAYTSTEIEIHGKQLPIGRSYKEQVHEFLNQI